MIPSDALDRVVEKETFAEILACLTPQELLTAALHLEGMSNTEIGVLLGMSRQAVRQRLVKAKIRIMHTRPDLAPALRGRHSSNGEAAPRPIPPLERGWLCDPCHRQTAACLHGDGPGSEP